MTTNDTVIGSTGSARSQATPASPASRAEARPPWRALTALLIGTFITAIDFFIVNVALPSMKADLHTTPGDLEWLVAAYSLGVASCLLIAGRLGDRFGRRRAFLFGIGAFTAASVLCAAAPDPQVLVTGRLVQGMSTAFVMTSVLAMIGSLFQGAARARAIGLYAAVLGVGAAAGQIIGGLLIGGDPFGLAWRGIFAINVPIGVLALVLVPFVIPATRGAVHRLDLVGMILMTAAVVALVLPLIEGRDAEWAPWVWVCFACVPFLVAAFVVQQRRLESRGGEPLFPRVLLRTPAFRFGMLWQLVFWCGQASVFVVLTMYLQVARGLTALESGTIFLGIAVPYLAAVALAPRLAVRIGRGVLVVGALCNLAGFAVLAVVALTGTEVAWLLVGFVLCGAAQGLSIPPSTRIVLATATPVEAGVVSGALSTMQQVGGSIGVAVVGTVFFGAAASSGAADAFAASLIPLAAIAVATLALTALLPKAGSR
ncbi:MFS transporter [Humibacter sp.]|jgi:MFS family permease|uniref:MFS transporter n=1 Tax=Humibacter sp. TaxID=1940291 RepID=UPI002C1FCAF2|nr:MFS transporter [Humibacter sp.]HVX09329.1 MFS transporter [Humibacter sp.]